MACEDYGSGPDWTDYNLTDMWSDGAFMDAMLCPYQMQLGGATFGMFVYGVVGIALFIYSDHLAVPMSVSMIAGGVIVTQLPTPVHQLFGILFVLGITFAGYRLYLRTNAIA